MINVFRLIINNSFPIRAIYIVIFAWWQQTNFIWAADSYSSHQIQTPPLTPSEMSNPEVVKKIEQILEEEHTLKGSFINSIIKDIKDCSNRMIELNYLTVKSSYWWDQIPMNGSYFIPTDYNVTKPLLIDKKYRSSVYDRETSAFHFSRELSNALKSNSISNAPAFWDPKMYVNSLESVKEKLKFFKNQEEFKNIIPNIIPIADGRMHYGLYYEKMLDTYPSVYQVLSVLNTLKRNKKKTIYCRPPSHELAQKSPSHIILEGITNIQNSNYYKSFMLQNHPLNKIVQDHLKKLEHKSKNNFFKEISTEQCNQQILYHKIVEQIGKIIELMSVFDIDMDRGICNIPTFENKFYTDKYYLYVQFYEILNDLLFLLMYVENGYVQNDFDNLLTKAYIDRFDVFKRLSEDQHMLMASYPMRSGMDAFVNASMAIGHAPQDISIAPKVAALENTVYFEISSLLKHYQNRGEKQSIIFLSEKTTHDQANSIIETIRKTYIDINVDKTIVKSSSNNDQTCFNPTQYKEDFLNAYKEGDTSISRVKVFKNSDEEFNDLKNEVKKWLLNSIKEAGDKDHFKFIEDGENSYIIVPDFIINLQGLFKKALESFPDLIESRATIDRHYSMTTGMTTDTLDQSEDPNSIEKLYKKINSIRRLKQKWHNSTEPFIILWDTTMEIDQGPCYVMMSKFIEEIKEGKVLFILFKSLQKYANLGIGKSRAGVVTLVGKNQPTVQKIHIKLTQFGRDTFSQSNEYALMTFFYDRFESHSNKAMFEDNEKIYYRAIRKHALNIIQKDIHKKYQIAGGCLFTKEKCSRLPFAETFGFAIATAAPIESGLCRYSVGLDPKGF